VVGRHLCSTRFPYTTLFRSFLVYTAVKLARENVGHEAEDEEFQENRLLKWVEGRFAFTQSWEGGTRLRITQEGRKVLTPMFIVRSEEYTSELQSRENLVCRL